MVGSLWLDLNGHRLSNITISGTLYGMDSSTDDYTDVNAGTLNCTIASSGQIISHHKSDSGKRYLTVPYADGGYGFHRFYLGITTLCVNIPATGMGYKAIFAGSNTVKSQLSSFGYQLWARDDRVISKHMPGESLISGRPVTLRLNNTLSPQNSIQANAENAQTQIHARVFMQLKDGTIINGSEHVYNFRDMIEAANNCFEGYSDEKKTALRQFVQTYKDLMSQWDIANILQ